jgi:hypothetical protein
MANETTEPQPSAQQLVQAAVDVILALQQVLSDGEDVEAHSEVAPGGGTSTYSVTLCTKSSVS